ncbi:hypothetical protein CG709_20440 [Lachnotalea glycerini]|nr:hypothetical protein CG709_20440 [Lachnotalea glycerini]
MGAAGSLFKQKNNTIYRISYPSTLLLKLICYIIIKEYKLHMGGVTNEKNASKYTYFNGSLSSFYLHYNTQIRLCFKG